MLFSILTNFYIANKIIAQKKYVYKKNYLFFGIFINVLLLVVYKYLNFFYDNLNILFNFFDIAFRFQNENLSLPIGISFFTFQSISLIIDVFKNSDDQKISLRNTFLYISLFPQLIAGPIIRYNEIKNQFLGRKVSHSNIFNGLELFIIGLAKKVIIADSLGILADDIFDDRIFDTKFSHLSQLMSWVGAIAFFIQIYFDFSGYSDMAIGLLKIFGFQIKKNFNYPYSSVSITEFWQRWHISLSSWFKDYLYIPLGGNRCGVIRNSINLFIIFFLCGLWHGASYNFIIWGLFHGTFLSFEKVINRYFNFSFKKNSIINFFGWIYTFTVVLIGWVFFRGNNLGESLLILQKMFDFNSNIQFWSLRQIFCK